MQTGKISVLMVAITLAAVGGWYGKVYLPEKRAEELRLQARLAEEHAYAVAVTAGSLDAALEYVRAYPDSKRFDEQCWEGLVRREIGKAKSPETLIALITQTRGVKVVLGEDSTQQVCRRLAAELADAGFPDNQPILDSYERLNERRMELEKQCAFLEKVRAGTGIVSPDLIRTLRGRFARIASGLPIPTTNEQALQMDTSIQAMPGDASDTQALARQMADYYEADFLKRGKDDTLKRFEAVIKLVTFPIPSHELLMRYAKASQQGPDQIARFIKEVKGKGKQENVKLGHLLDIATARCEDLLRPAMLACYEPFVKTFIQDSEPWKKDVLTPATARCKELKAKLGAVGSDRIADGNAPLGFPLFTNDAKTVVAFAFHQDTARFKLPPIEFPKVINGTLLFLGISPVPERQLCVVEDEVLKTLLSQLPEQSQPSVSVDGDTLRLSVAGPSETIGVRSDVVVKGGHTVKLQNLLSDPSADLSDACVLTLKESKKTVGYYKSSMGGLFTGIPAERTTVTAQIIRLRDRKLVASKSFSGDPAKSITLNLNGETNVFNGLTNSNDTDGSGAADWAMKQWLSELIDKASAKSP